MALQNKLKAFVRFDGSGRVIPSSLILQKSKPKVGNWKEINATECCNNNTTTTTTTASAPTSFSRQYWVDVFNACVSTLDGTFTFYSSSSTLQAGISVFTNSNLTTPVEQGRVIYAGGMNGDKYLVGVSGLLSLYTCPTTTTTTTADPFYYYVADQYTCPGCGTITGSNVAIKSPSPIAINAYVPKAIDGQIYTFKVLSSTGPNYMATTVDAGGASDICPCPGTTTTTTTASLFSGTVYISDSRAASCETGVAQYSKSVTGNGTTFCNSTEFSGSLENVLSGSYYVSFGGNGGSIPSTNVVIATFNGTGVAVVTEICSSC
jgi:hypothetical protein